MCYEQWLILLHERKIFDVDGPLQQPLFLTVRGIAALAGVGPVSWIADHEMINVIQSQLLKVFRVASRGPNYVSILLVVILYQFIQLLPVAIFQMFSLYSHGILGVVFTPPSVTVDRRQL